MQENLPANSSSQVVKILVAAGSLRDCDAERASTLPFTLIQIQSTSNCEPNSNPPMYSDWVNPDWIQIGGHSYLGESW